MPHAHTALPVPEAPPTVEVIFVNETAATIQWTAPPIDPNNLIVFYNITFIDEVFGLPDVVAMLSGSTYQYTVTGLEEYGNYTCEVISIGVFGTFSYPSTTNFTTLEAGELTLRVNVSLPLRARSPCL